MINEKPVDTETRILIAAEKEFLSKGYIASRTSSIAEAAGVTHAMLHYYFRSKDKLFQKVIAEKFEAIAKAVIIPIKDDKMTIFECFRFVISQHFDFIAANQDLPRFIIYESYQNEEIIKQLGEKIHIIAGDAIYQLQKKIDEYADRNECKRLDAKNILIDIISLNIFPIVSLPMLKNVFNMKTNDDIAEFLNKRKEENIKTILEKLKP